jgi:hypothetical protein
MNPCAMQTGGSEVCDTADCKLALLPKALLSPEFHLHVNKTWRACVLCFGPGRPYLQAHD